MVIQMLSYSGMPTDYEVAQPSRPHGEEDEMMILLRMYGN